MFCVRPVSSHSPASWREELRLQTSCKCYDVNFKLTRNAGSVTWPPPCCTTFCSCSLSFGTCHYTDLQSASVIKLAFSRYKHETRATQSKSEIFWQISVIFRGWGQRRAGQCPAQSWRAIIKIIPSTAEIIASSFARDVTRHDADNQFLIRENWSIFPRSASLPLCLWGFFAIHLFSIQWTFLELLAFIL